MRRPLPLLAACALLAAACSADGDSGTAAARTTAPAVTTVAPATTPAPAATATTIDDGDDDPAADRRVDFDVVAGTEQVTVTGATPGRMLTVHDDAGVELASGTVDETGALLFRGLTGGIALTIGDASWRSGPVTTLRRDEHPGPDFYAEQRLPTEGLGYVTTRDGTTLSASVWLPGPVEDGPYPTVVEYSGYTPSDPESRGFPDLLTTLGYAYVGVNIRGTGCSGGSFRFFEYAQSLDGYDVVETVAAQPWVAGHRVGLVGISYPGISQLFVAQTRPPSLAAITPFSVVADTAVSLLSPGGLLNTGFAVPWIEERLDDARPGGQAWAAARIDAGDEQCAANQGLRLQNPDLVAEIVANPFWTDEVAGELAPRLFVDRITVPTFVAGAWQDEQTGGHFATMLDRFTGTERFSATLVNGLHTDPLGPAVLAQFVEFLDLYVAERTPSLAAARPIVPLLAVGIFGTSELALPADDRFAGMSHAEALAAYEAEPPIRILFESGAADGAPDRAPVPRFEARFDSWPIPEASPTSWYLADGGRLADAPGGDGATTGYLALPDAVPATFYDGSSGGIWSVDVTYDWQEAGPGTFASWTTDPLDTETVVIGSASVDLWVQSNLGDTDLEVTITEIRPDGQEMYVQSGWLRASRRALDDAASTATRPVHTHLEADAAPLPDGEFELVRVEVFPFGHVFREGSRIRLIVDAPGGNRPVWEFVTIAGGEQVTVAHDAAHPSALVLPVVAPVDAPDDHPTCGALRGQPCRAAAPAG